MRAPEEALFSSFLQGTADEAQSIEGAVGNNTAFYTFSSVEETSQSSVSGQTGSQVDVAPTMDKAAFSYREPATPALPTSRATLQRPTVSDPAYWPCTKQSIRDPIEFADGALNTFFATSLSQDVPSGCTLSDIDTWEGTDLRSPNLAAASSLEANNVSQTPGYRPWAAVACETAMILESPLLTINSACTDKDSLSVPRANRDG